MILVTVCDRPDCVGEASDNKLSPIYAAMIKPVASDSMAPSRLPVQCPHYKEV